LIKHHNAIIIELFLAYLTHIFEAVTVIIDWFVTFKFFREFYSIRNNVYFCFCKRKWRS